MKQFLIAVLFFISALTFSQTPCDFVVNETDSIGTYKTTNEYLISEKIFGGTSNYIFYSLTLTDGLPILNVQHVQKSKDFLKTNCLDKNSKLYLQLNNGKVITLLHIDKEICGSIIRDDNGFNNRLTSGTFMFMKGTFEDLKNSPVSLMRIKYLTDTQDYIVKKEIVSELNGKYYQPENYFINNLHCVEE